MISWHERKGHAVFDERLGRNVYENGELKRWRAYNGYVGNVQVGAIHEGGKDWSWSSNLTNEFDPDDSLPGGRVKNEDEAKQALDNYIRGWLENFKDFR